MYTISWCNRYYILTWESTECLLWSISLTWKCIVNMSQLLRPALAPSESCQGFKFYPCKIPILCDMTHTYKGFLRLCEIEWSYELNPSHPWCVIIVSWNRPQIISDTCLPICLVWSHYQWICDAIQCTNNQWRQQCIECVYNMCLSSVSSLHSNNTLSMHACPIHLLTPCERTKNTF